MFRNTSMGKLITGDFTDFRQASYFIMTIVMYGFQIYSNILTCIRFHYHLTKLHTFMLEMTDYITYTTKNIDIYINYIMYITHVVQIICSILDMHMISNISSTGIMYIIYMIYILYII